MTTAPPVTAVHIVSTVFSGTALPITLSLLSQLPPQEVDLCAPHLSFIVLWLQPMGSPAGDPRAGGERSRSASSLLRPHTAQHLQQWLLPSLAPAPARWPSSELQPQPPAAQWPLVAVSVLRDGNVFLYCSIASL